MSDDIVTRSEKAATDRLLRHVQPDRRKEAAIYRLESASKVLSDDYGSSIAHSAIKKLVDEAIVLVKAG